MSERRVTLLGALIVALGPMSMALYTPAMPEIARDLATSDAAVQFTVPVFFAGFAFAQILIGPLADAFGRRPVTLFLLSIYLAASVVAAIAPSIEILLGARLLQGIGCAVGFAISRAIIRDLFDAESSARIMNLIVVVLAAGPSAAPFLGGIVIELMGWHAVFWAMVALGSAATVLVFFLLSETGSPDTSQLRPKALAATYARILTNRCFLLASLVVGGTNGVIYAQATLLSFVLIGEVGLSPKAFGISMIMQTGMFFLGSVTVRLLLRRVSAARLVPVGLALVGAASIAFPVLFLMYPPSLLTVMGPVAVFCYGIAFTLPAMMTAAMRPFPQSAGAASSMLGFIQTGSGMAGGLIGSLFADPTLALVTVVPAMGLTAIISWMLWRTSRCH